MKKISNTYIISMMVFFLSLFHSISFGHYYECLCRAALFIILFLAFLYISFMAIAIISVVLIINSIDDDF